MTSTTNSGHRHTNRLANETSPYLLQHAHNPVDWYPWGKEALERAKRQDKPIFLSIGYSTCYWCHVMERESFENADVARVLNENFIAIKVDREERPDIDEQYMLATQLMTGQGGWPNSLWLTPDGRPWMAATYFPREQFISILKRIADLWKTRRADVDRQADELAEAMRRIGGAPAIDPAAIDQSLVDKAVSQLREAYDSANGGFRGAPKFPPHGSLAILIHEYRRTGDKGLGETITGTLDAMAKGGIRDHVGGGFHRYAVDDHWLVPHFEKMLCDNAQLMRAYTDGFLLTSNPGYREAVEDTFRWIQAEMTDVDGGLHSAIDAGAVGEEGRFYVWRYEEIMDVLGPSDGPLFVETYGVKSAGNYAEERSGEKSGANILHLVKPVEQVARDKGRDPTELVGRLFAMRQKLLAARNQRPHPHKDDKVLAGWNGLMIESLAYAGRTLKEPRYVQAAQHAADFIFKMMIIDDGRLLRTYRAGQAKLPAYLDDYAFLAAGLLELHEADGNPRWLDQAQRLADAMLEGFQDKAAGGFFFTTTSHDDRPIRSKNLLGGGNIPSGNGMAAIVLLRLGRMTGEDRYTSAARRTLDSLSGLMRQSQAAAETLILAVAMTLEPFAETKQSSRLAISATQSSQPAADTPDDRQTRHRVTAELYASHHCCPR